MRRGKIPIPSASAVKNGGSPGNEAGVDVLNR